MKVMIVDDSVVYRSQIKAALDGVPSVEVVALCANGKIALQKLQQTPVDLITLDQEMPEMNGIQTLTELKKLGIKSKVLMFSALTQAGGEVALEALRLGADDIVAKPGSETATIENAAASIRKELVPKILQFSTSQATAEAIKVLAPSIAPATQAPQPEAKFTKKDISTFKPEVILIASSTGGPNALETVFSEIRGPLRIPILITQHMPPVFTKCLADRIGQITGIPTTEATQMATLEQNHIYVAPGNYHMTVVLADGKLRLKLDQGQQENMVRPAADPMFRSAVKLFGDKCMAFVLTGMGEDGCRGAKSVKEAGGGVMIQNKETCVVYGMPGAIDRLSIQDKSGSLQEIQKTIIKMTRTAA